jgi:hypothetical protein
MRRFTTTLLTVLFSATFAQAELIREVSVNSTADNNIFGTSNAPSDYLTEVSTYVANAFKVEGYDTRLF